MKPLLFYLCALFFSSTAVAADGFPASCPTCLPVAAGQENPAVVMILCYDKRNKRHIQGSGFFINNQGEILTSYHIIAERKPIFVRTFEQKEYRVREVLDTDIFGDLARLRIDIPAAEVHAVQLSTRAPIRGEAVHVIGHPLGHRQNITYGTIASFFPVTGLGNLLQFTAAITSGSSGSPLFNSSGEVVGVASFMLFQGAQEPSFNFAVPANRFVKRKTTLYREESASNSGS